MKHITMSPDYTPPDRIAARAQPYVGFALYFATILFGLIAFYTITGLLLSSVGIETGVFV